MFLAMMHPSSTVLVVIMMLIDHRMPEVEVNRLSGNKRFAEVLQCLHLELRFLVSVVAPNGSKVSRYFRPYVK